MIVTWKMSIGYSTACREGQVEIDDEDLSGLSDDERKRLIYDAIWEDALQYVDVYPIKEGG